MSKQLTAAHIEQLKPYALHMANAQQSVFRYPGDNGIEALRKVWADITGHTYPYQPGCARCITELLKDMGALYFAQSGDKPENYIEHKTYYYNEKTDRLETVPPKKDEKPTKKAGNEPVDAPKDAKATTAPKKTTTAAKATKTAKK